MTVTLVFLLALIAFILSVMGAVGKPYIWLAVLLLALAVLILSAPGLPVR